MKLDDQALLHCRFEQRPPAAVAVGDGGADRQVERDEARMRARSLELTPRHLRLTARHDDRGPQSRLALEPLRDLPVVDRRRERGRRVGVADALDPVVAAEDRVADPERVEQLGLDRLERRAGRLAGDRCEVGTQRCREVRRMGLVGRPGEL